MPKKGLAPLHPIKHRSLRSGVTGFTLLEILVATFILSIVMAGLVSVFMSGKKLMRFNRSRVVAGEVGKLFLDPFQLDVRQDTWGSNNLSNVTSYSVVKGESDGLDQDYNSTYTFTAAAPIANLIRVKANITWNDTEIP